MKKKIPWKYKKDIEEYRKIIQEEDVNEIMTSLKLGRIKFMLPLHIWPLLYDDRELIYTKGENEKENTKKV